MHITCNNIILLTKLSLKHFTCTSLRFTPYLLFLYGRGHNSDVCRPPEALPAKQTWEWGRHQSQQCEGLRAWGPEEHPPRIRIWSLEMKVRHAPGTPVLWEWSSAREEPDSSRGLPGSQALPKLVLTCEHWKLRTFCTVLSKFHRSKEIIFQLL